MSLVQLYQRKTFLKFFLQVPCILTTSCTSGTFRKQKKLEAFLRNKNHQFSLAILDDVVFSMNESFQAQFSFCQVLMLCAVSTSPVLTRIWQLVLLTIQKNKSNTSRKWSHYSQRGLGFHLCLDFLCLSTALTTDTYTRRLVMWKK